MYSLSSPFSLYAKGVRGFQGFRGSLFGVSRISYGLDCEPEDHAQAQLFFSGGEDASMRSLVIGRVPKPSP